MYSITVSHHFMAAHSLAGEVFGPAQRLHGATYVVEAELRCDLLDADGIVCDIGRALDLLKQFLASSSTATSTNGRFLRPEHDDGVSRRRDPSAIGAADQGGALGSARIASLKVVLRENPVAWGSYDAALE